MQQQHQHFAAGAGAGSQHSGSVHSAQTTLSAGAGTAANYASTGAGTGTGRLLSQSTLSSVAAVALLSDPLGVAERGKVGVPPSSSECSSNSSSVEAASASAESNRGRIDGASKGRLRDARARTTRTNSRTNLIHDLTQTDA